jgi:hypothetical protein
MKDKICERLESTIQSKLEELRIDWNVITVKKQDESYYVELEFYSNAGEDFVFDIWCDGTFKDFLHKLWDYSQSFDPDEHAEMWVGIRGQNGVPDSIRTLIDDADAIGKELEKTALKLQGRE